MAGDVVRVGGSMVTYVHDAPGSGYALLAWDAPPGEQAPPLHVHHHTEEGFYIASGRYGFVVGSESFECGAGAHVRVPPGVAHTFWNCGEERAVALIILVPPAFAAYFRELSRGLASADGEDARIAVRRALSARFDIEVLDG